MTIQQLMAGSSALVGMLMLILDGKTALVGASEGVKLCIQTLVPSLFPFFLFSNMLTSSFVGSSASFLQPIGKLFRIPQGAESLLVSAFLGGYPVGAQTVALAYRNGQISKDDTERMLGFCSNAGPSFLFGIVGFSFSHRKTVWTLWAIHIFSAWLVSRLLPPPVSNAKTGKNTLSITASMASAVKTMASVCGWVILFRVILSFLNRWFFWLLSSPWQVAITGILELSNGCCSLLDIENDGLRMVICSCILALGGLCVTLQTASVTQGLSLKYYFPGKALQCIFSILLSIAALNRVAWVITLILTLLVLFYGKTKNTGSNLREAVV